MQSAGRRHSTTTLIWKNYFTYQSLMKELWSVFPFSCKQQYQERSKEGFSPDVTLHFHFISLCLVWLMLQAKEKSLVFSKLIFSFSSVNKQRCVDGVAEKANKLKIKWRISALSTPQNPVGRRKASTFLRLATHTGGLINIQGDGLGVTTLGTFLFGLGIWGI